MYRTALIALGGNALIRSGEDESPSAQSARARRAGRAIVDLVQAGIRVLVTHGNGPQVGAALLRSEKAAKVTYPLTLDACVASTQGEVGYLLQQSLESELRSRRLSKSVVTLVTRVLVEPDDPAFIAPGKPIGPFYSAAEAAERVQADGWKMREDAGRGYRRLVPSPAPVGIVEEAAIRALWEKDEIVIAAGGGGIPVIRKGDGFEGVEAVVDKDTTSALLAVALGVELLAFATDTECVYLHFGRPEQYPLARISARAIRLCLREGQFAEGSMAPKIRSALRFLGSGGCEVVVTSLERLTEGILDRAGTHIVGEARPAAPAAVPIVDSERSLCSS